MDTVRQPGSLAPPAPGGASPPSSAYIGYVLIMLMLINAVAYVDRSIITVLAQPIKKDLGLSDTQLGFLTGFGFMIVYIFAGLPIARISERSSRVNVIALCVSFWSVMTALCGIAGSYWQLLLARIGVGAGESGAAPAAHSLIGDYVAPEKRGSAIGTFVLGNPLGIMAGSIIGGLVAQHFSWRAAFFVVGVPGLIIALLIKFTIREPKRGSADQIDVSKSQAPSLMVTLKHPVYARNLRASDNRHDARRHYRYGRYGVPTGLADPALRFPDCRDRHDRRRAQRRRRRCRHMGGRLFHRQTDEGRQALVRLAANDCARRFGAALHAGHRAGRLALACRDHGCALLSESDALRAVLSSYHNMTEPRMRATTVTISFIIANTLGAGGGPFIAGFLSDLFASGHFPGSYNAVCPTHASSTWCVSASAYGITISTMIGSMFGLWAAFHFWLASLTVHKDLLTTTA